MGCWHIRLRSSPLRDGFCPEGSRRWLAPVHIWAGTGLAPCHICTGTRLTTPSCSAAVCTGAASECPSSGPMTAVQYRRLLRPPAGSRLRVAVGQVRCGRAERAAAEWDLPDVLRAVACARPPRSGDRLDGPRTCLRELRSEACRRTLVNEGASAEHKSHRVTGPSPRRSEGVFRVGPGLLILVLPISTSNQHWQYE